MIRFENLLKKAIGLDVATVGRPMIEHAVRSRMALCGVNTEDDYWRHLGQSEIEVNELIECVVVPETSFFRDREAFTALAKIVLQEWLPANPRGQLRILSSPSSTGEEPYSIAMTLLDAAVSPTQFRIDAVDISARALRVAAKGSYGKNSFRQKDLSFRDRYFVAANGRFELTELVRKCVHFQQANLLAPDFLSPVTQYDVIFCRNVLIYFDAPTQAAVLKTLDRLLSATGVLFVGPSEAFVARRSGLTPADYPHAFAYRKTPAGAAPPRATVKASTRPLPPIPKKRARVEEAAALPAATDYLATAAMLADSGRLAEAADACEAQLRDHGPSAPVYHLLGVVRDAMGDHSQAADLYRKALYLDPNHADALAHLALIVAKHGNASEAKRLRLRARRAEEIMS